MNFLAYLFWNHFISVTEERRVYDGKEQVCLVVPTEINQIKKGRQGNWMSIFRLAECEPNARAQTHDIQLTYLSEEEVQKSYDFGYHRRTAHLGRVYEHDRTPEKKIDRTNNASDIRLDGIIFLSDIPKELIYRNELTKKRYISNLTFRALQDDGIVYQGSLCIDDIPLDSIEQNQDNGKKFIRTRFLRMNQLDTYFNTHILVVAKNDGTEVEIGRFKEFHAKDFVPKQQQTQYPEIHNTNVNQRNLPDSIQGIKF